MIPRIDSDHYSAFMDFCAALETETDPTTLWSLHDEINSMVDEWNGTIDSIMWRKSHGRDIGPAVESLVHFTDEINYPMDPKAAFEEFSARSEYLSMYQAAIESRSSMMMDSYDEDAALEAESLMDEAIESELDKLETLVDGPAMEGANIQALSILKQHLSETRAMKKEMNEAKNAKDWKAAADKAAEIAANCDKMKSALDNIPDSVGSAAIVTVILAIATLALAVGAAAVAGKVGGDIAKKKAAPIAKEAGNKEGKAAAKGAYERLKEGMRDRVIAENPRPAPANAASKAAPKAPAQTPSRSGIKFNVKFGKKTVVDKTVSQKTVDKISDAIPKFGEDAKYQALIKSKLKEADAEARAKATEYGRSVAKAEADAVLGKYKKAGSLAGNVAGASAVTVPALASSLTRALKGKKVIDENGNPKKVALTANEWNALIRWSKGVIDNTKKKYLEQAKSFRARLAAKEAFDFYMTHYDPACEQELDEFYTAATEGVNMETLDIWHTHSKEITKLRREMKYAAEAGDPGVAAKKANEICKKCDDVLKELDALPQSAMAANLPRVIVMIIVALTGVKLGPWLGKAGGEWIGRNMAEAATSDIPKFLGKPIQEICSKLFGIAGAFMPGVYAFKGLLAMLRGKMVVTASGKVTTTKISPNEANVIMNAAKSSIRSCKRKYEQLAKNFEQAVFSKEEDRRIVSRASAAKETIAATTVIALEAYFYEEMGIQKSAFNDFMSQIH